MVSMLLNIPSQIQTDHPPLFHHIIYIHFLGVLNSNYSRAWKILRGPNSPLSFPFWLSVPYYNLIIALRGSSNPLVMTHKTWIQSQECFWDKRRRRRRWIESQLYEKHQTGKGQRGDMIFLLGLALWYPPPTLPSTTDRSFASSLHLHATLFGSLFNRNK